MTPIEQNLLELKAQLPPEVQLIVVSKTKPVEKILEAYHAGQRKFGENYVQEIITKQPALPADIEWHFIGHLQSNKVKYLAPFITCIHSIDSAKLLAEVDKQSRKFYRTADCLLQVHVALEETKFGWAPQELIDYVNATDLSLFNHVRIRGIMGMASFSDNEQLVRSEFGKIRSCFDALKQTAFRQQADFDQVSMGMSGDWKWAVEEGSTMVRVGSAIFGARIKP